jgi:hypothetical protein
MGAQRPSECSREDAMPLSACRAAGLGFATLLAAACVSSAAFARAPDAGRVLGYASRSDDISASRRAAIGRMLATNASQLGESGPLPRAAPRATSADGLAFPLRPFRGSASWADWASTYFVDHDPGFPNRLLDYACGQRTYDSVGYNHGGTDYVLWPFPWLAMDEERVRVVAATPGVVLGRNDGNFDRNCAFRGNDDPINAVYIRQDDGLIAWYLHMKRGSVTPLPLGARVEAGDYLGLVGSSGPSSVPHLHFELHDAAGNVVDPRHGDCNAGMELWAEVQPYENPRLTTLTTHSAEPTGVACGVVGGAPVHESAYYQDHFAPGDTVWVFASWGDHRNGQPTTFTIQRPDASVFAEWTFDLASEANPEPFYSGTAYAWRQLLPDDAPQGTWTVQAEFHAQVREHRFTVGDLIFRDRPAQNEEAERTRVRRARLARCRAGAEACASPG